MAIAATSTSVNAGNISQKPDPALLERFEAERTQAQAERQAAQELRKQGEEKIRRGREMQRKAHEEAVAELCRIGALPASECH